MNGKEVILYIGGFELPDKNAAAQRVVGIAKGFRELGYEVIFLNSLKNVNQDEEIKTYFGFKCYEYGRESEKDYLFTAKTVIDHIKRVKPNFVVAYNYPGIALERIRRYCKSNGIKCIADATEWYKVSEGKLSYRVIKSFDSYYRMRIVHKRLDGVIAISRFLYEYYKDSVKTVMIPPTVDLLDDKWNVVIRKDDDILSFIYAGSPSTQKERLDLIVEAVENLSSEKIIRLNVVGITKEQFIQIYGWIKPITERIVFWGRVRHDKVIELTKASDWTMILRDNNWVVNAGFPTKFVESISCGTPVIINRFSNVEDYIKDSGVLIDGLNCLEETIISCLGMPRLGVDNSVFDYHNFLKNLEEIMSINSEKTINLTCD